MKQYETTESLLTELNKIGGKIIVPVIKNYKNLKPQSQDESEASYTKQFTKQDGYIDLSILDELKPLKIKNWKQELDRKIRAYYPWPTVWTKTKINNRETIIKFLPENKLQVEV